MGVVRAGNLETVGQSNAQVVGGGLRFDSSKSNYLTRTPGSAGNRTTWTWSGWVKRNSFGVNNNIFSGVQDGNNGTVFYFDTSNCLNFFNYVSGGYAGRRITTNVYRDSSSWYHILLVWDSTNATVSNRIRIYVNGIEVTTFSTSTDPSSSSSIINSTNSNQIGADVGFNNGYSSLQLSNAYFIDGQALDPSYFGFTDPLTNVWRPKKFKPQATPNNGTVWSSSLTAPVSGFGGSVPATNAFDNNLSTLAGTNNAVGANLLFTKTFTNVTRLRVWADHSTGYRMRVNGGTWYTDSSLGASANASWRDLTSIIPAGGTITSIEADTNGANNGVNWAAIEVNGVILLDSDTTNMGKNAFYLPFDGSAPIGQDQSGRGNNWTPVNFGGSNTIEKATGALPILNTDGGGKVAKVGVRTDAYANSLVLALPLVGVKDDVSNRVNSGTSNKTVTNSTAVSFVSTTSNFYGGSAYFNGSHRLECDFSQSWTSDFTIEGWVYRSATGSYPTLFDFAALSAGYGIYAFVDTGASSVVKVQFFSGNSSGNLITTLTGTAINVDSGWHHFAVVKSGTTYNLYQNGILTSSSTSSTNPVTTTTLNIGNRSDETPSSPWYGYIQDFRVYVGVAKYTSNFIPASTDPDIVPDSPSGVSYSSNVALVPSTDGGAVAFNGSTDWLTLAYNSDYDFTGQFTLEAFVYPSVSTGDHSVFGNFTTSATGYWGLAFDYSTYGVFTVFYYQGNTSISNSGYAPIPRAWNHYAVTRDASNVIRVFLNGQLLPTTATYSGTLGVTSQNSFIGFRAGLNPLNGLISNVHWVKGTCLYTTNFTPPTGPISSVANTKLLCCKSQTSATAADVAPASISVAGNAVASNFNPFTVNINTQRGKQSGYCTWNPLKTKNFTLSEGNLRALASNTTTNSVVGTIGASSGKWYWEVVMVGGSDPLIGICNDAISLDNYPGGDANGWGYYSNGNKYTNSTAASYGASYTTSDVIGVALNMDAGTVTFYKNGISQGQAYSGLTGTIFPAVGDGGNSVAPDLVANFGQKPFKFPPPAGFQPLTLANTPRPTIVRPDQYVGVTTYTGTASVQSINVGWKPDFVWIKDREVGWNHQLYDSVRGVGANKELTTSQNWKEGDTTNMNTGAYGYVSSLDSYGFTLNPGSGGAGQYVNQSTKKYVAWAWKAGGNSNTYNINDVGYATASAAGITEGTQSLTGASINTKSGFSIVRFTQPSSSGAFSFGHGLGKTPNFVIMKSLTTSSWYVYHSSLGSSSGKPNFIVLNSTGAAAGDSTDNNWGTGPTSTIMNVGDGLRTGGSASTIAYLWAEIPGFSKFGSYTGDGSTSGFGPFIQTGFRPRYVLIKSTTVAYSWLILDAVRNPYNLTTQVIYADTSGTEMTNNGTGSGGYESIDILSNGFQIKSNSSRYNQSGQTYIYAAFAESPTFNLYGAQSNAR